MCRQEHFESVGVVDDSRICMHGRALAAVCVRGTQTHLSRGRGPLRACASARALSRPERSERCGVVLAHAMACTMHSSQESGGDVYYTECLMHSSSEESSESL